MHNAIYDAFKSYSEKEWVELILQTPNKKYINDIEFPGFPDPEIQTGMVGSSGETALREISPLYFFIHSYSKDAGINFTKDTKLLDFGCGYGRIFRFFMKDIAPGNLVGTDVDQGFVDICRNTFLGGSFDVNTPYPPLQYADASFDIIFAFSIFSHLSEKAHLEWLQEFKRILKPGGLLFLTLRQKSFLMQCAHYSKLDVSGYQKLIADAFGRNHDILLEQYEKGDYIYAPHGGGGVRTNDYYGDTVVPPLYVKENWSKHFSVVDTFDDLNRLSQALVILQKTS